MRRAGETPVVAGHLESALGVQSCSYVFSWDVFTDSWLLGYPHFGTKSHRRVVRVIPKAGDASAVDEAPVDAGNVFSHAAQEFQRRHRLDGLLGPHCR